MDLFKHNFSLEDTSLEFDLVEKDCLTSDLWDALEDTDVESGCRSRTGSAPDKPNPLEAEPYVPKKRHLSQFPVVVTVPKQDSLPERKSSPFVVAPKKKAPEEDYYTCQFDKFGWICCGCTNFNYENRTNCNKCAKEKSAKLKEVNEEQIKKKEMEKVASKNSKEKKKKPLQRHGDWFCAQCQNLNFSFRFECNRCFLSKLKSQEGSKEEKQKVEV